MQNLQFTFLFPFFFSRSLSLCFTLHLTVGDSFGLIELWTDSLEDKDANTELQEPTPLTHSHRRILTVGEARTAAAVTKMLAVNRVQRSCCRPCHQIWGEGSGFSARAVATTLFRLLLIEEGSDDDAGAACTAVARCGSTREMRDGDEASSVLGSCRARQTEKDVRWKRGLK